MGATPEDLYEDKKQGEEPMSNAIAAISAGYERCIAVLEKENRRKTIALWIIGAIIGIILIYDITHGGIGYVRY